MSFFGGGRFLSGGVPIHDHSQDAEGGAALNPDALNLDTSSGFSSSFTGTGTTPIVLNNPGGLVITSQFSLGAGAQLTIGAPVLANVSANKNNYNPLAAATAWCIASLNVTGSFNLTGLDSSWAVNDGTIVIVTNVGSGTLTCKAGSASSSAQNRLAMTSDLALATGQSAAFVYDNQNLRWRLLWAGVPPAAASSRVVGAVTIAAAQNDWAPFTPLPDVLEVTTGLASRTITGIVAGTDGQAMDVTVSDGGASALVLVHNSASSAVANRFLLSGANRTITVGTRLIYDGSVGAWKALGGF